MRASADNVKVGNTLIFKCDEFSDGRPQEFDGQVQMVKDDGVDVIYLSGYRSRNDFIPWADILAKLDKRKPYIKLDSAPYSGHFVEYA
ncbi:MAG: hypothetical protein OEL79_04730 [Chromatiales bacterium]|nr:hypothetical protein [Chromatiales bacterium]